MKSHKSISPLLLILALLLGMASGCSMKSNLFELDFLKNFYGGVEKVNKKRFTLMYKPKLHADNTVSKMHLHPVKLSKEQVRQQVPVQPRQTAKRNEKEMVCQNKDEIEIETR